MWSPLQMLIKFRHLPSPNLNRVPFKGVPSICPVWYYFATKLTGRFIRKVFLWSTPLKESEGNANTNTLDFLMSYAVEYTGLCDPDFSRLKREGLSMTSFGRKRGDQCLFHGVKRQKLLCGIARHPTTHCNCRLQHQTGGQLASLLGEHLQYKRRVVLMETSENSL